MKSDPRIDDLPATVHLLMVNRFILLPETTLPLVLTDPRYGALVELLGEGGYLGFILADEEVGCLGRIRELERHDEGVNVLFEGAIRFRVRQELPGGKADIPRAEVDYGEFAADLSGEEEDLDGWDLERIKATLLQIGQRQSPANELAYLEDMPPRQIIRLMAQTMPFAPSEKQALLEAQTFRQMLELLFALLAVNFLTTTPDSGPPQVN
jgi:Lon protease-like protein